jgi:hypothetical protein
MIVDRLLQRDELERHRETINDWLRRNFIDPELVAMRWISIERNGSFPFIRYHRHKVDAEGCKMVDPDHPNETWTEVAEQPMIAQLPDLPITEGHHHPGG